MFLQGQAELRPDKKIYVIDGDEYCFYNSKSLKISTKSKTQNQHSNSKSPFGFFSFGPTSETLKKRVQKTALCDVPLNIETEEDSCLGEDVENELHENWIDIDTSIDESKEISDIQNLTHPVPKAIISFVDPVQTVENESMYEID